MYALNRRPVSPGPHAATSPTVCAQVKYDQEGNRVVGEVRDYLGALQDVTRLDAAGRQLPGATDAELALLQVG